MVLISIALTARRTIKMKHFLLLENISRIINSVVVYKRFKKRTNLSKCRINDNNNLKKKNICEGVNF